MDNFTFRIIGGSNKQIAELMKNYKEKFSEVKTYNEQGELHCTDGPAIRRTLTIPPDSTNDSRSMPYIKDLSPKQEWWLEGIFITDDYSTWHEFLKFCALPRGLQVEIKLVL